MCRYLVTDYYSVKVDIINQFHGICFINIVVDSYSQWRCFSVCVILCAHVRSPIWNNTGVNLTFHVPSTDVEGVVKVCVLLPDGSCHGNAEISYWSSPFCNNIVPRSSWIRFEWSWWLLPNTCFLLLLLLFYFCQTKAFYKCKWKGKRQKSIEVNYKNCRVDLKVVPPLSSPTEHKEYKSSCWDSPYVHRFSPVKAC